jgi:hypothetical protein
VRGRISSRLSSRFGCHSPEACPAPAYRVGITQRQKSPQTHFESYDYSQNTATYVFSPTYSEVPFLPCVFKELLGGSFIFNVFFAEAFGSCPCPTRRHQYSSGHNRDEGAPDVTTEALRQSNLFQLIFTSLHPKDSHLVFRHCAGLSSAKLRRQASHWGVHCSGSGSKKGNPAEKEFKR